MQLSEIPRVTALRDGALVSVGPLLTGPPNRLVALVDGRQSVHLEEMGVAAVVTTPALASIVPESLGLIVTESPERALIDAHRALNPAGSSRGSAETWIDPSARIHPSAVIADRGIVIGPRVQIGPGVIVEEGTVIEGEAVVRAGSILGATPAVAAPASGGVEIGARAEIHANVVLYRGLFLGDTSIGADVKIDNLVTVGWNSVIAERTMLVASSIIGNGVRIGKDAWIGPNATISDDLAVGDRSFVTLGSLVTRDIPADRVAKDNYVLDRGRFKDFV